MDRELGEAVVVYDEPGADEPAEIEVENEHVVYFQDHWLVKIGEDDEGNDRVRRIPATRVYYVERSVEEFEAEAQTLLGRVESVARRDDLDRIESAVDDVRDKIDD